MRSLKSALNSSRTNENVVRALQIHGVYDGPLTLSCLKFNCNGTEAFKETTLGRLIQVDKPDTGLVKRNTCWNSGITTYNGNANSRARLCSVWGKDQTCWISFAARGTWNLA